MRALAASALAVCVVALIFVRWPRAAPSEAPAGFVFTLKVGATDRCGVGGVYARDAAEFNGYPVFKSVTTPSSSPISSLRFLINNRFTVPRVDSLTRSSPRSPWLIIDATSLEHALNGSLPVARFVHQSFGLAFGESPQAATWENHTVAAISTRSRVCLETLRVLLRHVCWDNFDVVCKRFCFACARFCVAAERFGREWHFLPYLLLTLLPLTMRARAPRWFFLPRTILVGCRVLSWYVGFAVAVNGMKMGEFGVSKIYAALRDSNPDSNACLKGLCLMAVGFNTWLCGTLLQHYSLAPNHAPFPPLRIVLDSLHLCVFVNAIEQALRELEHTPRWVCFATLVSLSSTTYSIYALRYVGTAAWVIVVATHLYVLLGCLETETAWWVCFTTVASLSNVIDARGHFTPLLSVVAATPSAASRLAQRLRECLSTAELLSLRQTNQRLSHELAALKAVSSLHTQLARHVVAHTGEGVRAGDPPSAEPVLGD